MWNGEKVPIEQWKTEALWEPFLDDFDMLKENILLGEGHIPFKS